LSRGVLLCGKCVVLVHFTGVTRGVFSSRRVYIIVTPWGSRCHVVILECVYALGASCSCFFSLAPGFNRGKSRAWYVWLWLDHIRSELERRPIQSHEFRFHHRTSLVTGQPCSVRGGTSRSHLRRRCSAVSFALG